MAKTVRDVIGDPETWSNYGAGGMGMPLFRGATIVGTRESEPDELKVVIDARGRSLHSTFVIADRDVRQRLIEILKPGLLLEDAMSQSL